MSLETLKFIKWRQCWVLVIEMDHKSYGNKSVPVVIKK